MNQLLDHENVFSNTEIDKAIGVCRKVVPVSNNVAKHLLLPRSAATVPRPDSIPSAMLFSILRQLISEKAVLGFALPRLHVVGKMVLKPLSYTIVAEIKGNVTRNGFYRP
jgi:hypothetical protein